MADRDQLTQRYADLLEPAFDAGLLQVVAELDAAAGPYRQLEPPAALDQAIQQLTQQRRAPSLNGQPLETVEMEPPTRSSISSRPPTRLRTGWFRQGLGMVAAVLVIVAVGALLAAMLGGQFFGDHALVPAARPSTSASIFDIDPDLKQAHESGWGRDVRQVQTASGITLTLRWVGSDTKSIFLVFDIAPSPDWPNGKVEAFNIDTTLPDATLLRQDAFDCSATDRNGDYSCLTTFARPAALEGKASITLNVAIPMLFSTPGKQTPPSFSVPSRVAPNASNIVPPGLLVTTYGPYKFTVSVPLYPEAGNVPTPSASTTLSRNSRGVVSVPATVGPSKQSKLTVEQAQRLVTFPIFIPTTVPAGLSLAHASVRQILTSSVQIDYPDADGTVGLSIIEGPTGCCLDTDPRKGGTWLTLPAGSGAHFLPNEPQFGGPILWWDEARTYVAIAGPQLTQDVLVRVAASMAPISDTSTTSPTPISQPLSQAGSVWQAVLQAVGADIDPILKPAGLPEGFESIQLIGLSQGDSANPATFRVEYDGQGKQLLFGVGMWVSHPECGSGCSMSHITIRGQQATIQVNRFDSNSPPVVALWWSEPGRWASFSGHQSEVGYTLWANGLTVDQVQQIASSLVPVSK